MDYIHIDKLKVRGRHGVGARERNVEQEFELSLRFAVGDTRHAAESHKLSDAVDYQPIKNAVLAIVGGKSCYLIETLAERIAVKVLEDKRIRSVELTIKKPQVWEDGVPGLTIQRSRVTQR